LLQIAMIYEPIPHPSHDLNVMVADGCLATVPSINICECCMLINLTFVLVNLGLSRGLNSDAVSKVGVPLGPLGFPVCFQQFARCQSLILQLVVASTHGLHTEQDTMHVVPQVSSQFTDQVLPPVLMALLPRSAGGHYPVFEDAVFRLNDMCPSSHEAKREWLAANAVSK
jgi:hypothetical protein